MKALQTGALREQRFDSATLSALARKHSSLPLRRAGALTELVIVGAADSLAGQPDRPTYILYGSKTGISAVGMRLVTCIEVDREMPYPFDFLASQPIIAVVALQKSFPCIQNAVYQPWSGDVQNHWQHMRTLATAWLSAQRCERVLCGQIEPDAEGREHVGCWQMLTSGQQGFGQ